MSATRSERERELWELSRSPGGMLELSRLHEQAVGCPSGVQSEHTTSDVGPMIVRILEREFPNGPQAESRPRA